jgi:hypothetical protein
MATFIDESGDIGTGNGASRFFRLAAVWFESNKLIDEYLALQEHLKKSILKTADNFEFHFADISHRQKSVFFDMIKDIDFYYVVSSFDKSLAAENSKLTKDTVREQSIDGLAGALLPLYQIAEGCKDGSAGLNERIVYDECDDPKYVFALNKNFRILPSAKGVNEKLIRSIKPGKSKSDPRLQLADMVCGAVGRYLGGDDEFYKMICRKEMEIRLLGAQNEKWPTQRVGHF